MDDSRKRESALRWTTAGLVLAAIYVCWPLWPALVLAAWTADLARPSLNRFARALKGRQRAAAALTMILFLVVVLPLGLMVVAVIAGAQELVDALGKSASAREALAALAAGPADGSTLHWPRTPTEIVDLAQSYGAQGFRVLSGIAGATAAAVVGLFIYFGGAFVFLVDGPALWRWMERQSPLDPRHLERLAGAFRETGRGLLVGVGLTTLTQGVVATLIYLTLGVPRWWVLGPITGLASVIPLIGSALVWAPISLGFFLTGHAFRGALVAVLGLAVISTADNLLRPVFARVGSLRMPMFLLFVSAFGGVAAFGAWGAMLGPLIVRMSMEALALRQESAREAAEGVAATP